LRAINTRRPMRRILQGMSKAILFSVMMIMAFSASGCGSVVRTPGLPAVDDGNAVLGRAYAEHTCAACHAVAPRDMRSPDPRARPFDAIANTPGMTHTALNAWLHSSHTNMPALIVEPESVDNLYAYLLTLRRRP
jgi:mono/diheme cytochrome c family protein